MAAVDPFTQLGVDRHARQLVQGYRPPPFVAPPGQLAPQHARTQTVQMPTNLPANLQYGHITPGLAQSQRFTGGVVQKQTAGQTFAPPPDYVAPTYQTFTGVPPPAQAPQAPAPLGARLASALQVSAPVAPPPPPPGVVQHAPASGYAARPTAANPNPTPSNPAPAHLPTPQSGLSYQLAVAAQRGTRLPGGFYQQ
jgi:hypothetical protein